MPNSSAAAPVRSRTLVGSRELAGAGMMGVVLDALVRLLGRGRADSLLPEPRPAVGRKFASECAPSVVAYSAMQVDGPPSTIGPIAFLAPA